MNAPTVSAADAEVVSTIRRVLKQQRGYTSLSHLKSELRFDGFAIGNLWNSELEALCERLGFTVWVRYRDRPGSLIVTRTWVALPNVLVPKAVRS